MKVYKIEKETKEDGNYTIKEIVIDKVEVFDEEKFWSGNDGNL